MRLLKLFFIFQLSVFGFQFAFARTVTLPVHGLVVASDEPVPLDVEWDEKWFWEGKPTEYNHNIARIAALFSEISYVRVEEAPEHNPLIQSYHTLGFKDDLIEMNYILDYAAPITGNNQAAYSFAAKEIQTPNGKKTLVFVILRGTPLSANEWLSNLNISDTTHENVLVHEGFSRTVSLVHTALIYYLLKNKISPDDAIFLITGHSRGAALANLLGVTLEDEGILTSERLFVYTFASPNVSQEDKTSDTRYNFIWNIVNAEDMVPSVPPNRNAWRWRKFGHLKVLVNFWNAEPDTYDETLIPRVNAIFKKLLLRTYAPFKSGPFYQTQLARVLTTFYRNIEKYYGSVFGLRNIAENILLKTFPEDEEGLKNTAEDEKQPLLVRMVQRSINTKREGGFDYIKNAFVDMHACETYLSILLALDEEEAFSDMGSSQIVISGSYDCAVYDDDGTLLARVIDGILEISTMRVPIAAMPLLGKIVIGFPKNKELNVVLLKDSILPTAIPYKIEYYDSDGSFFGETYRHYLFPQGKTSISFTAGSSTFASERLNTERLFWSDTKALAKKYDLRPEVKFKILGELSFTGSRDLYVGVSTGSQKVFLDVLGSFPLKKSPDYACLSLGIGRQHSLYGRILLGAEVFNKFYWSKYDGSWNFDAVPSARLTLSLKPGRTVSFFAGPFFDFNIRGFNDDAFRDRCTHKITDKLQFAPSFNFGIRF